MKCDNKNVPSYLHWNERKVFGDKDFLHYHRLYRLKSVKNPIEIPDKYANAISCRWSKIIKKQHITIEPPKPRYSDYDFVFLQEIRNYKKIGVLENHEHEYSGRHVLTCVLHHDPLNCDFSHSEILIRHQVFRNGIEQPIFDEVYTHSAWVDRTALLNREGGKFFKGLKKAFRLDMIKLISIPSSQDPVWQHFKAYCNRIKANVEISPAFTLE